MLAAVVAALASGCRGKPADAGEVFAIRTLGLAYLQRGQLPEATAQFKRLIALEPDKPVGYADLGLTYLQSGLYREAEEQLLRAKRLDAARADVALLLAKLYMLTGRPDDARTTLEPYRDDATARARVLYALAQVAAERSGPGAVAHQQLLAQLLEVTPSNVAVRLEFAGVLLQRSLADSALQQLEALRRIPPAPPPEAKADLDLAIRALQDDQLATAREAVERFTHIMEGTAPFQASFDEVKWAEAPLVGRPVLTFAPTQLRVLRGVQESASLDSVQFIDVTDEAGLLDRRGGEATGAVPARTTPASAAVATGDVDGDGDDDLFVSSRSTTGRGSLHLYHVERGFARDVAARAGIALPGGAVFATFADVDNDGWLDLFAIGGEGRGLLFRNNGSGSFQDASARARIDVRPGQDHARVADLDHDGDLDLLLMGGGHFTVSRNNLDGSFTDATREFGLSAVAGARDAAFGDFDGDGRLDLAVLRDSGDVRLLLNQGAQRFVDRTATSGLSGGSRYAAIAVGDYDNDGRLDLFGAGRAGEAPALWLNRGAGRFAFDDGSAAVLRAVQSTTAASARFTDYDNDGWLDLFVVGEPQRSGEAAIFLLHNRGQGTFESRSERLPPAVRIAGGSEVLTTDIDGDGDEDAIVIDNAGSLRLLRNEKGNRNLAVRVALKALGTGSGKNNAFGIGARLELRAGALHQSRVVTDRVTHFGLGPHLKADVLRIEWPNGVPQIVYIPGTDQDVVEAELLKGSCAFLYAWDGTGFHFITDVMWRSALGMPLGLMAGGGAGSRYAPAGASQEYIRIPGSALQPRNGRYVLQLTEELWETAYIDQIKLLVVDHPDSVDVFTDERFVPPGPLARRVFQAVRPQPPRSATDDRGNDLLPVLRRNDFEYASKLTPTRYQGVVEPHDLILDLGADAGRPGSVLFLRGWIYPTDASINVAIAQQSQVKVASPSLEVRDRGRWVTAIPNLSFPSGKDKTVAVDLTGIFPTSDHVVRIRTNMQIYWDQAFVATDAARSPNHVTTLEPIAADLHYRGFSRPFRKGGRHGPHWFAYEDVEKASPWRTIDRDFTRFGDVLPLLRQPDDMYVIMGPGDETTIEFDASSVQALPPGWKRDYFLYSDGWIKDSDLNTAHGTSVGPLPFHRATSYPYAPGEAYPSDAAHQRYMREYNTRRATR